MVTEFERREIRNHIKESDEQLRYYLAMVSERLRRQARTVEDVGDSLAKLKFPTSSCLGSGRNDRNALLADACLE
jgi:hypothetical protein